MKPDDILFLVWFFGMAVIYGLMGVAILAFAGLCLWVLWPVNHKSQQGEDHAG